MDTATWGFIVFLWLWSTFWVYLGGKDIRRTSPRLGALMILTCWASPVWVIAAFLGTVYMILRQVWSEVKELPQTLKGLLKDVFSSKKGD